jgi:small nuclear ribonucleoprotein
MDSYDKPFDMVQKNIGNKIYVRLRNRSEIEGILIGYDEHLNMMLENASIKKKDQKNMRNLMYLRDSTVLILAKQ